MGESVQDFGAVKMEQTASGNERVVPVTRRIANAQRSLDIHEKLVRDNNKRDARHSRVIDYNAGAPPFPQAYLNERGLSWYANFNSREHEAVINELATIFYDLIDNVPTIPLIKNTFVDELDTAKKYGRQISECYHKLLTEFWPGFVDEYEGGVKEMLLFDVFLPFFYDERTFQFRHLKSTTFLLPERERQDPDVWELMEVRWPYKVSELWRLIATPEARRASKKMGWNDKAIEMAIVDSMRSCPQKDAYQLGDASSFAQMMANNDVYASQVLAQPVLCAQQFSKEMDGKVRRMVIYERSVLNDGDERDETTEKLYLFDKLTDFESFRSYLDPIYLDVETYYDAHRGIGEKIFNQSLNADILNCDIVSTARIAGSFFYKGRGRTKDRKLKLQKFTYVDDDFEFINNVSDAQIDGPLAVSRFLTSKMSKNIPFQANLENTESVQPLSAADANIRALRAAGVRKSHVNRVYRGLDRLLSEMYRRLLTVKLRPYEPGYLAQKKFFDACEDIDIPREALEPKYNEVKAYRTVGFGGLSHMNAATAELREMAVSGVMPDPAKANLALHIRVATLFNYTLAQELFPVGLQPGEGVDTAENTLISLEMSHLQSGQPVAVEPQQRHDKHVTAAVSMLEGVMQELAQDPVRLSGIMSVTLAFIASHMDAMSRNPVYSRELARVRPVFAQLVNAFQQIRAQAEQVVQAQVAQAQAAAEAVQRAEQNQVDPDVLEVMRKYQVKELDQQLQGQARMQAVNDKHNERLIKTQLEAANERLKIELEAQNERIETAKEDNVPRRSDVR